MKYYDDLENLTPEEKEKELLKEELIKKLLKEFEKYKDSLKDKTPEEIIQNFYELTVKQEIIDVYDFDLGYSKEDLKMLIKEPNLLDQGYDEWLSFDGNLREVIFYPVEHLNEVIQEENEKNPNKDLRYSEQISPNKNINKSINPKEDVR